MQTHRFGMMTLLLLCAGATAPVGAQQSRPDHDDKPGREEGRRKVEDRGERVGAARQNEIWVSHRAHSWENEHRTWVQRGGYKGARISDLRFRRSFGREHLFRLSSRPMTIVGGFPRFQSAGYWFSLVDPWPEFWPDNWYLVDDVFIDRADDGYYLYDQAHPSVRLALVVVAG